MARFIRSRGNDWPMTPVEAGKTKESGIPNKLAAVWEDAAAAANPASPVQALALPLFTRIAWAWPRRSLCWQRSTGAALTLLVVNTPAAFAGLSATIRARSRRPGFLMAASTAAARNPGTRRFFIIFGIFSFLSNNGRSKQRPYSKKKRKNYSEIAGKTFY